MEKIKLALKSRTVWTIIVLFIINGITGIDEYTPETFDNIVNPLLTLIAIYFRVNPKV
jgi:hypothetical protein